MKRSHVQITIHLALRSLPIPYVMEYNSGELNELITNIVMSTTVDMEV
jgi:hypothetical protein